MVCLMHKKWLPRLGPKLLAPPRGGRTTATPHRGVGDRRPPLWGGWVAKSIWDPSPSGAGGHRMARGYTRVNVVYHFFEVRYRTPCQGCWPVCLSHPVIQRFDLCETSGDARASQCNEALLYDIVWRICNDNVVQKNSLQCVCNRLWPVHWLMECQCTHWLMVCQWISTQMVMRTSDWWHCLLTALFTVFSRVLLDDTISVHKANRARLIRVVGPFLGGKWTPSSCPPWRTLPTASIVKSKEALFIRVSRPP